MSQNNTPNEGPDFSAGMAVDSIEDGAILRGHVRGEAALAIRKGDAWRIVGATCSHYGLPLAEGLVVDEEIHCPFHHARFCLKSGKVLGAPALDPIASWSIDIHDGIVRAGQKQVAESPVTPPKSLKTSTHALIDGTETIDPSRLDTRIVIIGGGAAGNAAAEMLRAKGHRGSITMLSADADRPYDRPKCSKAVLSGQAKLESVMLRDAGFYEQCRITLHTQTTVTKIDPATKTVSTREQGAFEYDALLIATGAEPKKLEVPGADLGHVHYLRTLRDTQSLIDASTGGSDSEADTTMQSSSVHGTPKRAVVIGASFIGLETAASLRARGLDVSVVSPAPLPMEKLLGKPLSDKLRAVHEQHGVTFHVGSTVDAIDAHHVHLDDGSKLPADLVVVGIGVAPRVDLAKAAGITVGEGIVVNALLQTNIPDIYAAGDVAEWPDPFDGQPVRIEHWVVAERQGQAIAQTLLGSGKPFRQSPFFWSIQYDFGIGYIGHVRHWDHVESDGDLDKKDWSMTYFNDGAPRAMAIVSRNHQGLEMETMLETQMQKQAEKN